MNWRLIATTALVGFAIVIFGSITYNEFNGYNPIVNFLAFLINSIGAGAYVYQNSDQKKLFHGILAFLGVPLIFILFIFMFGLAALFFQFQINTSMWLYTQ
ncbi:MAG: hypothetical protein ABI954_04455 [Pyrinomonadaceae bacterium]